MDDDALRGQSREGPAGDAGVAAHADADGRDFGQAALGGDVEAARSLCSPQAG